MPGGGGRAYVQLFRNDGGLAHLRGQDEVVPLVVHSWEHLLGAATQKLGLTKHADRVFTKYGDELYGMDQIEGLAAAQQGVELVISQGEPFRPQPLIVEQCKGRLGHAGGARAVRTATLPRTARQLWHSAVSTAHQLDGQRERPSPAGRTRRAEPLDETAAARQRLFETLIQSRRATKIENFMPANMKPRVNPSKSIS